MMTPELLVPAGDMEKLEVALDYGADAVYVGGNLFGLRAMAGNFSIPELARARALTRDRGKKLYLTLNAYLRPAEMPALQAYLEELRPLDIDAYIVSDPGVMHVVRQNDPTRELHLSTQANTTNAQAAAFWQQAGAGRVNLARELTLEEIRQIRRETDVELEVFVHGAMCVAYSGRCLLSSALTGRSANAGACAQPCRWGYALVEETRPGQYFAIEEDSRGTYLLNSRDLCLVEHLPELLSAGVNSLKIEGRMKTLYYVAAVTRVYRAALDRYLADPGGYVFDPAWLEELDKVSHRPYDKGFLFGAEDALVHARDSRYQRTHDFVGIIREGGEGGRALVECRNRFFPGEQLELMGPQLRNDRFTVEALFSPEGHPLDVAQPNARVLISVPEGWRRGDLLRREKSEAPD